MAVTGPPERLVLVGGGGVGKTTLAAALAVRFASQGARTLVMTFDPSLRLKDTLGIDELGHQRPVRVALQEGAELYAHLLDARDTFVQLVHRYAPDRASRDRILANRFFDRLAGQLAGILEYMAVERLYEAVDEGRYERIILDTPPTREALEFLDAPERIVSFLDSGAIRMALRNWFDETGRLRVTAVLPGLGKRLDRLLDEVVGLELLRDMAEFFQAFAPLFDGFRERALEVREILASPKTGFILVCAPVERAVADAVFFARSLVERSYRLEAVVANRVHPEVPVVGDDPRSETGEGAGLALMRWLGARDRVGARHLQELIGDGAPVLTLPLLPVSPNGPRELAELGEIVAKHWKT